MLALGALEAGVVVTSGAQLLIAGYGIFKEWTGVKAYLESSKLKNVARSQGLLAVADTKAAEEADSKALTTGPDDTAKAIAVIQNEAGELTILDGLLVGSSTTGLVLLMTPSLRWYGAATLMASFLASRNRDNAKLIGVASSTLALTVANPPAAAAALFGFASSAAQATASSVSSAIQLSTTISGVLVAVSGAVVVYILNSANDKRKQRQRSIE